jgi:hypothetical protein
MEQEKMTEDWTPEKEALLKKLRREKAAHDRTEKGLRKKNYGARPNRQVKS